MTEKPQWASHTSFVFAASAAAIGLGNIWRFPYMVGQNGGGVFVITYLICVAILGIPLILCEILLGRTGKANPALSFARAATASERGRWWAVTGFISIVAGFFIMTYYTVIAGWVLDYTIRAISGEFHRITSSTSQQAFSDLQHNPWQMILTTTIVIAASFGINLLGIKDGLERAVMIMFPVLLILLLALLGLAIAHGRFDKALHFLFDPSLKNFHVRTILLALGQAFFSLNIGMGVTIMFSAYLPRKLHSVRATCSIALADTAFALLSGLIIFPFVFAYHLKLSAGPSLIFQTLPLAFGQFPFGSVVASLFFIMLFFAAFSSIISIFEPVICWVIETFKLQRSWSTLIVCGLCWCFSWLTIASFSHQFRYFKVIDFITAAILLPLGGFLTAIFCGWILKKSIINEFLHWKESSPWYKLWRGLLRYLIPLAIILIFLVSLDVI